MQLILLDVEALRDKDHHDYSEIVELGAVKLRSISKSLIQAETFQSFIKPVFLQVKRKFCHFTHIEKTLLETAEPFAQVIDRFQTWIGDEETVFIGWSTHDRSMLIQNCKFHGIDSGWICTSYADLQEEVDQILGSKTNTGLKAAMDQYGIRFKGVQHRALDDALNTAAILKKILPEASETFLEKLNLNERSHSEKAENHGHGGKIDEEIIDDGTGCRSDAQRIAYKSC